MTPPKEIKVYNYPDGPNHMASFSWHAGIAYAKSKGLIQCSELSEVRQKTHFIVMCGDVVIRVEPTDFPEIERI
jgi:hypothetical protein